MVKQNCKLQIVRPPQMIDFPEVSWTQNDAPEHHTQRAPKSTIQHAILVVLEILTKIVTKNYTKKLKKC